MELIMNKIGRLKGLIIIASASILSLVPWNKSLGYELAWPQPTPPPGTNPALFPLPRLDWVGRFLSNLDRTRGKQIDLIFDGDSITDYWQGTGKEIWAQHYGALKAADFGISGDQVQHVLWRIENGQLEGLNPRLVVLLIGSNNMPGNGCSALQTAEGIKLLVAEYEKRCPTAHILLLGIFPRAESSADPLRAKIIATNRQIAALDDGKRVTFLDFGAKLLQPDGTLSREMMPDFLHPSAKGYEIWADTIQPIVDKYCPKAP
jgi:lysophospholipase L1-like esterase